MKKLVIAYGKFDPLTLVSIHLLECYLREIEVRLHLPLKNRGRHLRPEFGECEQPNLFVCLFPGDGKNDKEYSEECEFLLREYSDTPHILIHRYRGENYHTEKLVGLNHPQLSVFCLGYSDPWGRTKQIDGVEEFISKIKEIFK